MCIITIEKLFGPGTKPARLRRFECDERKDDRGVQDKTHQLFGVRPSLSERISSAPRSIETSALGFFEVPCSSSVAAKKSESGAALSESGLDMM